MSAASSLRREGTSPTPPVNTFMRSTHSVDTAWATLGEAYGEVLLGVPRTPDRFHMRLQSVDLADVHIRTVDLSTASIRNQPFPFYTIGIPVRGRIRASVARGTTAIADGRGVAVCPNSGETEVEYLTDDCCMWTVSFAPTALEAELELMLGHPVRSVNFEFGQDMAMCGALRRMLALVRADLTDPSGMLSHPSTSRRLSRMLISGVLLGARHDRSDELRRPAAFEGPLAIRLAVAAIEERAAELVTVGDIARAANLSVRALEDGFRRHVGTTPMAHLRSIRLERAHDELVDAEPGMTTTMAIAHRWGFTHHGRFAAQYRERFGRSPSQTLKGGRGREALDPVG